MGDVFDILFAGFLGWILLCVFFKVHSWIWEVVHEECYGSGAVFVIWRNRITGCISILDTR